jgi:hypothetical protein
MSGRFADTLHSQSGDEPIRLRRMEMISINRKWSTELRLAYIAILFFIMAQYVVNERPWDHIFRIAGLLTYIASMFLAARRQSRCS